MQRKSLCLLFFFLLLAAEWTWAGGSNYGVAPGPRPSFAAKVTEWPVPTPKFARDPAIGPDGNIYIAVMYGNKIARFSPKDQTFKEWDLPSGARPHGLLVAKNRNNFSISRWDFLESA